jgi:catechol 2,3-dioxygenase-like lactoylglutathione lyase family enzyme
MLSDSNVCATIAVKDLEAARKFYEEVLGLHDTVMDADYAVVYKSGDSMIQVYPSQYAGTNQATAATWEVKDIQAVIDDLKGNGPEAEDQRNGVAAGLNFCRVIGDRLCIGARDVPCKPVLPQ